MTPVETLSNNIANFNVNATIESILKEGDYSKFVPDMVRERLWEQGIYPTGKLIETFASVRGNLYAQNTVFGTFDYAGKIDKGQPYDRVTLRDTGVFYTTFSLQPKSTSFSIDYNDQKEDGLVSDNIPDLPSVFGLSDGELQDLRLKILPDFITAFKNGIKA